MSSRAICLRILLSASALLWAGLASAADPPAPPSGTFAGTLDVPVAPAEWGKPISGDGGEIGAAFRAYNTAWDKGDRKTIFEHLDSANQAR